MMIGRWWSKGVGYSVDHGALVEKCCADTGACLFACSTASEADVDAGPEVVAGVPWLRLTCS